MEKIRSLRSQISAQHRVRYVLALKYELHFDSGEAIPIIRMYATNNPSA